MHDVHAEIYLRLCTFQILFFKPDFFCDYMDTDLKLGKFHTGLPSNRACVLGKIASAAYKIEMMFVSIVGFSTELRFLR